MTTNLRTLAAIKNLRHAVVSTIKSAKIAGIGDNVFESRQEKFWPEESTICVVNTDNVSLDDQRTSPKVYKVDVDVTVDIIVQDNDSESADGEPEASVNDSLDDLTLAVATALQPAMPKDGFFGGITKRFVLTSITNNLSVAGEMTRGCQRLVFASQFSVTMPVGGPADEFLKAGNTISMGDGEANRQTFTTQMRPSNA